MSLSAYCSSGPGWPGLAPAVCNVLAPHEPGPAAGTALYWLLVLQKVPSEGS